MHRFAGYATVSLGALVVVSGLVLPGRTGGSAILAASVCSAIALIWYSRRISRSLEDEKQ
jgi:hypothetical protein